MCIDHTPADQNVSKYTPADLLSSSPYVQAINVSGIIKELWHCYCRLYSKKMKTTFQRKEGQKFTLRILIALMSATGDNWIEKLK